MWAFIRPLSAAHNSPFGGGLQHCRVFGSYERDERGEVNRSIVPALPRRATTEALPGPKARRNGLWNSIVSIMST